MTDDTTHADGEELELLLPWYANGTLDPAEAARIEAALARDPGLRHSLSLIMEDRGAAIAAAEEIPAPASLGARFQAQLDGEIDTDKRRVARRSDGAGLFARIGAWLADGMGGASSGRLGLVATAAAVIITLQAALIGSMLITETPGTGPFRTATGDAPATSGPAFLIRFAPEADMAALTRFLDQEGATLVDGPASGGFYTLRFADPRGRSRDDLAGLLRSRPALFEMVLPRG